MYGTQTVEAVEKLGRMFENDVKMYGTQTVRGIRMATRRFENDVKMYGTQTRRKVVKPKGGLRMM